MIGVLPAMFKREQTKILSSEFLRFFDLFDLLFNLIQHLFHAPLSKWKAHCQVPSALFAAIGRWKCVVDGWCIFFSWNIQTNKSNRISTITSNKQTSRNWCGFSLWSLQLIHWARSVAILLGVIKPVQNFTEIPETFRASAPGFRAKPWSCSKNWSKTLVKFGYEFSGSTGAVPKVVLYQNVYFIDFEGYIKMWFPLPVSIYLYTYIPIYIYTDIYTNIQINIYLSVIYICTYVHIYIYPLYAYIHISIYIYTNISVYIFTYIIYIYPYTYIQAYIYIHIHTNTYNYIHIHTYTYIYTHIHTYTYYIHIHIYIHLYLCIITYTYIIFTCVHTYKIFIYTCV